MSLVACTVVAALMLGGLRGGSLTRLGGVGLRAPALVVAALAAQAAGLLAGGLLWALGLLVSAGLLAVWLHRHRGLRGTGLVALGLLANAVVIALNGAMPVSAAAAARAGVDLTVVREGRDPRHEPSSAGTRARLLSDVVPVPLPLRPEIVSPGDVLVAAGLGQLVLVGMGGGLGLAAGGGARRRPRGTGTRAVRPLPAPGRVTGRRPPAVPLWRES